ncbi:MAG: nucleotidyltransferase family protein [Candidatus Omnitrophica bacterium]|nr:nucleotidyltransferase family protein [Candidatus Omnitrophota bacterium]
MRSVENICVSDRVTIKKAVEFIDKGKLGIVLVIDKQGRLSGIITDVDVRKGILKGVSFSSPVKNIMNKKSITVLEGTGREDILSMMKQHNIRQIPVLNEKGQVEGIEIINDYFKQETYPNDVVIMAGGLGKRLHPLTKNIPKSMLTIGDKPLLENMLETFKAQGFINFIITISYKKETIKKYFGNGKKWGVNIRYLVENKPLGTAGALSLFDKRTMKHPFLVVNSDLLTAVNFSHMLDYHNNHKDMVTVGIKDYIVDIPYGIIKLKGSSLEHFEEKPSYQVYINAGVYVFNPEVLKYVKRNEPLLMTDFIETVKNKGGNVGCFPIHEYWMDIGHIDNYKKAKKDFRKVFK